MIDPEKTEQDKQIFPEGKPILDEPPPFLGRWPIVYRFILVYLAALIFGLWLFTKHYAPPL